MCLPPFQHGIVFRTGLRFLRNGIAHVTFHNQLSLFTSLSHFYMSAFSHSTLSALSIKQKEPKLQTSRFCACLIHCFEKYMLRTFKFHKLEQADGIHKSPFLELVSSSIIKTQSFQPPYHFIVLPRAFHSIFFSSHSIFHRKKMSSRLF